MKVMDYMRNHFGIRVMRLEAFYEAHETNDEIDENIALYPASNYDIN